MQYKRYNWNTTNKVLVIIVTVTLPTASSTPRRRGQAGAAVAATTATLAFGCRFSCLSTSLSSRFARPFPPVPLPSDLPRELDSAAVRSGGGLRGRDNRHLGLWLLFLPSVDLPPVSLCMTVPSRPASVRSPSHPASLDRSLPSRFSSLKYSSDLPAWRYLRSGTHSLGYKKAVAASARGGRRHRFLSHLHISTCTYVILILT